MKNASSRMTDPSHLERARNILFSKRMDEDVKFKKKYKGSKKFTVQKNLLDHPSKEYPLDENVNYNLIHSFSSLDVY